VRLACRLAAAALGLMVLAACQSSPQAAQGTTTTVGNTTITTSGSVAVEAGYVN
jgi:hypothetical protein